MCVRTCGSYARAHAHESRANTRTYNVRTHTTHVCSVRTCVRTYTRACVRTCVLPRTRYGTSRLNRKLHARDKFRESGENLRGNNFLGHCLQKVQKRHGE